MSTFKFSDYTVKAVPVSGNQSILYLICPECPGTRAYFSHWQNERIPISRLSEAAMHHHNEHHREPHLEGNGQ